ncbi:unnamed protein product [Callosobruchus maculatus]|uniref:Uncharacterized protein n=1 Tax=Callosobruchus maculatus TaxID=64391 RepID=A0A653BL73_CALMS|nr:unnamed protein product [Callosobruchus maculatus]
MRESIDRLLLLNWKYWCLNVRRPCYTITIFLCPIVVGLTMCLLRLMGDRTLNKKEIYEPFCVSPNPVPFLCPFNSTKSSPEFDSIPKSLFYSPDNLQLAKVMNIYKVFGYEVKAVRNAEEMVATFKVNPNTTMAGIQFDNSYEALADLKDIKTVKVSIRFPAELRHPMPQQNKRVKEGIFWDTERKLGVSNHGPRNPKSSIGGNPSMYIILFTSFKVVEIIEKGHKKLTAVPMR